MDIQFPEAKIEFMPTIVARVKRTLYMRPAFREPLLQLRQLPDY